ncbi:MAG TPA: hypothetical protein VGA58_02110 [bacterium]
MMRRGMRGDVGAIDRDRHVMSWVGTLQTMQPVAADVMGALPRLTWCAPSSDRSVGDISHALD